MIGYWSTWTDTATVCILVKRICVNLHLVTLVKILRLLCILWPYMYGHGRTCTAMAVHVREFSYMYKLVYIYKYNKANFSIPIHVQLWLVVTIDEACTTLLISNDYTILDLAGKISTIHWLELFYIYFKLFIWCLIKRVKWIKTKSTASAT